MLCDSTYMNFWNTQNYIVAENQKCSYHENQGLTEKGPLGMFSTLVGFRVTMCIHLLKFTECSLKSCVIHYRQTLPQ